MAFKPMKLASKLFLGFITYALTLAVLMTLAGMWWLDREFTKPGPLGETTLVEIERGLGLYAISNHLANEGVIENTRVFNIAGKLLRAQSDLKAGEYELQPGMSAQDILRLLREGKTFQRQFTIPEGLTSFEIVRLLNAITELSGEILDIPPEGSLLPETYSYALNEPRGEIIARLTGAMSDLRTTLHTAPPPVGLCKNIEPRRKQQTIKPPLPSGERAGVRGQPSSHPHPASDPEEKTDNSPPVSDPEEKEENPPPLPDLYYVKYSMGECLPPPLKNWREVITLASIVEKETGVAGERKRVAGVFINRLKKGIALQTDPTIIYAITMGQHKNGGKGPLGRRLLKKDLELDSPYNTYEYPGLPPGPIANPGRAAIEAVLNPEAHEYLYFVADGSGGHIFAKTLEEHNRNVAKWRKIRRGRK